MGLQASWQSVLNENELKLAGLYLLITPLQPSCHLHPLSSKVKASSPGFPLAMPLVCRCVDLKSYPILATNFSIRLHSCEHLTFKIHVCKRTTVVKLCKLHTVIMTR